MIQVRILLLSVLLVMIGSCVMAGQIVYQEDFSNPFVVHDWVYSNSGPDNVTGYGGVDWPCKINGDGWPLPNYQSYPAGPAGSYWSPSYNHKVVSYGENLHDSWDVYDWMSCYDASGNPVNTDPTKPGCFQASLPAGWTAAFTMWGDWDPNSNYYMSGRGKMGFSRLMGAYAEAPNDPCLHVWSSSGDMRVVSAPITSGPGVYTLSWKASVWNGNTADPAQQYKWTDWCEWGYGYTNWCAWDDDPITQPPYASDQVNQIAANRFWVFSKDPFHDSNPDGDIPGRAKMNHPAGEEPGQWHSFSRSFAFGMLPVKKTQGSFGFDPNIYEFNQDPGYFIGFHVGHAHDDWNKGYKWATILNVDDIVLTKKDPVKIAAAKKMPIGTLVEVDDMVITNIMPPDPYGNDWVDIYVEAKDRSAGSFVRFMNYADVYDANAMECVFHVGDVVNVVGAVYETENGIRFIGANGNDTRLPAVVSTQQPQILLKPVAVSGRDAIGQPVAPGLGTDSMLIKVYGKVNNPINYSSGWFYIDDGSGLEPGVADYYSGIPAKGMRVNLAKVTSDPEYNPDTMSALEGDVMSVTGTLSLEFNMVDGSLMRVLTPRDHNDLMFYNR